jgi:hypothetical protein
MSVQNPTIPTATQAKGIDAIILDLQTHLDTELVWLTNGMGRAYRLSKVRTDQTTVFLPEVYLGVANRYDYFAATPDNDKQGQNVFFVGDAILPDQQKGFYGWLEYEVGIIFNANLETIDSALLVTEDFTEHLIQDVREALIRDLVGKSYRLTIDSITREFDDVYAEFDVSRERGIAHAPLTHFRVNCTITFREDCAGVSLDRCGAILQNLSTDDKLNCILPTYDFSTTAVQDATTAQQQADMTTWLCGGGGGAVNSSFNFDGVNEYVYGSNGGVFNLERTDPFSFNTWVKVTGGSNMPVLAKWLNSIGYLIRVFADGRVSVLLNTGANLAGRKIDVITGLGTFPFNTWANLTVTYDGSLQSTGLKIYINKVDTAFTVGLDGLTSPFTMQNIQNLQMGGSVPLSAYGLGLMYLNRMWDISLSGTDVSNQYDADLIDIGNSDIPSTNVQAANLIMRVGFGHNATWALTDWNLEDEAGVNVELGFKSVNMEQGDRNEIDIPT